MDSFSHARKKIGLTISIKETNVMIQDVIAPPSINNDNVTFDVVDQFTYLSSTITSNLSVDAEINTHKERAAAVMSKLNKRALSNTYLRENTKLCVYQTCVFSSLLCGCVVPTTYTRQETD